MSEVTRGHLTLSHSQMDEKSTTCEVTGGQLTLSHSVKKPVRASQSVSRMRDGDPVSIASHGGLTWASIWAMVGKCLGNGGQVFGQWWATFWTRVGNCWASVWAMAGKCLGNDGQLFGKYGQK